MHPDRVRLRALDVFGSGSTIADVSRSLGLARSTVGKWKVSGDRPPWQTRPCPRCDDSSLDGAGYATLLGFYLGDGHLARHARYWVLSIACDSRQPLVVTEVEEALVAALPNARIHHVVRMGATRVQAGWTHWPCLFPQHGPGRKHERPVTLEDWQARLVEAHPASFLRGLLHSDGCRVNNWARRPVAGELKRYEYPRWQFVNHSADIRELCCWALDLVQVPWRQSNWKTISVSTRDGVARVDSLVGPKC